MAGIPVEVKDADAWREVESRMSGTKKQLFQVVAKIDVRHRDKRRAELTLAELQTLKSDENTYKAVGKMYFKEPIPKLKEDLHTLLKQADKDIKNLEASKTYLEKQFTDLQKNMSELIVGPVKP